MKHWIFILGLSLWVLTGAAQQYVVTSITGRVVCEAKNGEKKELALRQTLTQQSVLNLPYNAQVELFDEQGGKTYLLKVPGKGVLANMLKDRQNSVMQLTEQYLAYMKARVKGKGELTSRRYSDPATVTREIAVKQRNPADAFNAFRRQAHAQYDQFRQKAITDYAAFMRKAWQSFEAHPALTLPEEKKVEPIVAPQRNPQDEKKSQPVRVDGAPVVMPAIPQQSVPTNAIHEQDEEESEYVDFEVYGTPMHVRFTHREQFSLPNLEPATVANVFERLQSADYNNTIRDCLELRMRHQLCDWTYLKMLEAFSKACFSSSDEATLLMAFIFQQSGYQMRLGVADGSLMMLFASRHVIFGRTYFTIGNETFYPYGRNVQTMKICEAAYPHESPLSLLVPQAQMLAEDMTEERRLTSEAYSDLSFDVSVNRNLLTFCSEYPSSTLNDDLMTRWTAYANTPLEAHISASLLPALQEKLNGLSEREAVERLLNWVQTAFNYEIDNKVWGHDRAFFAEETLYYPYCDCEDRSILLSRLVRELLGLKTILVYYPGHLAMAVGFSEEVEGDYIELDGKRFVVCDPTFINASVGMTMPDMNNQTAKVILLE